MADVLNKISDPMFCGFLSGFRKEKLPGKASWVLKAGIKSLFEHIDHDLMMKFIERDI
jgi:hypothetical protein